MKIRFDPCALEELNDAADWYEAQGLDLQQRFRDEIDNALKRTVRNPSWGITLNAELYRVRVKIFPYKIIYAVLDGSIVVVAVAHNHRAPDYWVGR